ncbi:MAG: MBL fold metallo-hydrolase [Vicinamibacterales bacterium]
MKRASLVLVAAALCAAFPAAQPNTLDIYVVDVEGGNATLFVTPVREAVLIDTGNGGPAAARDAHRIITAVNDAGITQIDALVTTHWHGDHMGAMAELANRIPIRHYLDHGGNVQPAAAVDTFLQDVYPGLIARAKHTVVKAGDVLPLKGVGWRFVASARDSIKTALPGAGAMNPHCAGFTPHTVNPVSGQPVGNTEDEHSVGSHVTFGKFRALYLADFPWNKEFELMCPNNRLGIVDFLLVSRHGQHSSNSPALVHAVRPRVAVINNGIRKGGQPETMRVLYSSPGLEDLWQVHAAQLSGPEHAIPGLFAANIVDDPEHSAAHWIKVSAQSDGSFTVTNSRNTFSKRYALP